MSDARKQRDLEALIEALDDEPVTDADAKESIKRLGIDVKKWAGSIRTRLDLAEKTARAERFKAAGQAFERASAGYEAMGTEPARELEAARQEFRRLSARLPREASVHFHKFEEATAEELAEMIKAMRHLLNEDEK